MSEIVGKESVSVGCTVITYIERYYSKASFML